LSFLFYELLESPEAYSKAEQEVEQVCGKEPITVEHMGKLPYIEACLRETLRLHPTAPSFTVEAKIDQDLDGYSVRKGERVTILLARLHRDPGVYGADAESFRPSRMQGEAFENLPSNAWKVSVPRCADSYLSLTSLSHLVMESALALGARSPGKKLCSR
jgi:cytochrome P450/NADPH-cytochrome P450 reductase